MTYPKYFLLLQILLTPPQTLTLVLFNLVPLHMFFEMLILMSALIHSSKKFFIPTDKFDTEDITLLPHVEIASNADPFIFLTFIFDTYRTLQNLLQIHPNSTHALTMSFLQVNDFLKILFTHFFYQNILTTMVNLSFSLSSLQSFQISSTN